MSSDPNYDEIRRRIKRKYDNRAEFLSHIVAFIICNTVLWGALQPQYGWETLARIVMSLWFMGLVIHSIQSFTKEMQERAIERAIEHEREWQSQQTPERDVKRKRDRLRLTADGELLDVVDEDDEQVAIKR